MAGISESELNPNQDSRRNFLAVSWIGSLGLLTAGFFTLLSKYVTPRTKQGEFGTIIEVGKSSELPAINEAPLNHPKGKFWLANAENGFHAFYKACTHLDCLFNWNAQENVFVCPCHGSQFAKEGTVLTGPATRSLDQFAILALSPNGDILAKTNPAENTRIQLIKESSGKSETDKPIRKLLIFQGDQKTDEIELSDEITIAVDTRKIYKSTTSNL